MPRAVVLAIPDSEWVMGQCNILVVIPVAIFIYSKYPYRWQDVDGDTRCREELIALAGFVREPARIVMSGITQDVDAPVELGEKELCHVHATESEVAQVIDLVVWGNDQIPVLN